MLMMNRVLLLSATIGVVIVRCFTTAMITFSYTPSIDPPPVSVIELVPVLGTISYAATALGEGINLPEFVAILINGFLDVVFVIALIATIRIFRSGRREPRIQSGRMDPSWGEKRRWALLTATIGVIAIRGLWLMAVQAIFVPEFFTWRFSSTGLFPLFSTIFAAALTESTALVSPGLAATYVAGYLILDLLFVVAVVFVIREFRHRRFTYIPGGEPESAS